MEPDGSCSNFCSRLFLPGAIRDSKSLEKKQPKIADLIGGPGVMSDLCMGRVKFLAKVSKGEMIVLVDFCQGSIFNDFWGMLLRQSFFPKTRVDLNLRNLGFQRHGLYIRFQGLEIGELVSLT